MPYDKIQNRKDYYDTHKEIENKNAREYYLKNKEKILEAKRCIRNTYEGKKKARISQWRNRIPPSGGLPLICDDYDLMYEYYMNTEFCDNPECKVKLTEDKYHTSTTRCLDHDHKTGEFRFVLCNKCNTSSKHRQY